ncbi:hypothetical protein A3A49_02570 [Candidatus Curtissbacteria bacterium RIFCSPLOWO2_01_FULL_38_11b]|uniref:NAD(P)-binding domain-containing protein n=1 Tax=Candidatus Curtissbacteria bacterium RIFCSPLOWO2_01_FULL_38_11b TaxID=1797725 RepID=A0A1F5GYM2_9BACT|nr:MAG: hypothetical protein A3A49_02570 [Candidatus Curtissbacteria bacterium RIFCSPLOWO2_01_FULL_38_11b]
MKKALNSVRNQGSSKKVLITGVAGFVGSHLTEYLLAKNIQVTGVIHPKHSISNIKNLINKITVFECNIQDKRSVAKIIDKNEFDYIFHLAAYSSPAQSYSQATATLENNIFGELNLLETLVKIKSKAKVLIVGSSDEYGNVSPKYLPVKESAPLAPISPYAVSKVAQDLLGLQFYLHHALNTVRVRPFNHIGPRQSTAFVIPAFVAQIVKAQKENRGEIRVGNLNTYRDFTDVRDIVRAYLLALEKGESGEVYNIGSGKAYKIGDVLDKLISMSGTKLKVIQDKKLIRESEVVKIYCDFKKFNRQTGWKPQIPIDQTLSDTMDYERRKLT